MRPVTACPLQDPWPAATCPSLIGRWRRPGSRWAWGPHLRRPMPPTWNCLLPSPLRHLRSTCHRSLLRLSSRPWLRGPTPRPPPLARRLRIPRRRPRDHYRSIMASSAGDVEATTTCAHRAAAPLFCSAPGAAAAESFRGTAAGARGTCHERGRRCPWSTGRPNVICRRPYCITAVAAAGSGCAGALTGPQLPHITGVLRRGSWTKSEEAERRSFPFCVIFRTEFC